MDTELMNNETIDTIETAAETALDTVSTAIQNFEPEKVFVEVPVADSTSGIGYVVIGAVGSIVVGALIYGAKRFYNSRKAKKAKAEKNTDPEDMKGYERKPAEAPKAEEVEKVEGTVESSATGAAESKRENK